MDHREEAYETTAFGMASEISRPTTIVFFLECQLRGFILSAWTQTFALLPVRITYSGILNKETSPDMRLLLDRGGEERG